MQKNKKSEHITSTSIRGRGIETQRLERRPEVKAVNLGCKKRPWDVSVAAYGREPVHIFYQRRVIASSWDNRIRGNSTSSSGSWDQSEMTARISQTLLSICTSLRLMRLRAEPHKSLLSPLSPVHGFCRKSGPNVRTINHSGNKYTAAGFYTEPPTPSLKKN